MSRQGFDIIRKYDGDVLILKLSGGMDSASAGTLKSVVGPLCEERGARILLDCTDLTYVNSMAMGQFAALSRACDERQGRMALCAVYPTILEVMKVLSLDKLLKIYPTQAAAVSALRK